MSDGQSKSGAATAAEAAFIALSACEDSAAALIELLQLAADDASLRGRGALRHAARELAGAVRHAGGQTIDDDAALAEVRRLVATGWSREPALRRVAAGVAVTAGVQPRSVYRRLARKLLDAERSTSKQRMPPFEFMIPRKAPAADPAILRLQDDPELQQFERRLAALDARKARLAKRELELAEQHQRAPVADTFRPGEFDEAARAMLRSPPAADVPIPERLHAVLRERRILDRALEFAVDEGQRVSVGAFNRVRQANLPAWNALVREFVIATARVDDLQRQRDRIFAEIGYGPFGRMPLPLSEIEVAVRRGQGAGALSVLFDAAVAAGVATKEEFSR